MIALLQGLYNFVVFRVARGRALFWSLFLRRCGKHVYIKPGSLFFTPSNIEIGDCTLIGERARFGGKYGIKIGSFVSLAGNVSIMTNRNNYSDWQKPMCLQGDAGAPVEICDDVWIGVNAVILSGVTVGRGAIIGSSAVVTKDVEAYAIVGGVPARTIKYRMDGDSIAKAAGVDLSSFVREY